MQSNLLLEKELEPIFLQKFPPFSEDVKEFLVKYGPYIMLFFSILGVFGLLTAFGVGGAIFGMGAAAVGLGAGFYVSVVLGVVTLIMYLMAFSPLKARKRAGWNLLYYALLLGLISNLIQFAIIGFLISALIGFWVLFQIREKYV